MPETIDPIYVQSIKVSAGPFTVETGPDGCVLVKMLGASYKWDMEVSTLLLLSRVINEYLHMRSMEGAGNYRPRRRHQRLPTQTPS